MPSSVITPSPLSPATLLALTHVHTDLDSDSATLVSASDDIGIKEPMSGLVNRVTSDERATRARPLPTELYYYILSCADRDIFFTGYLDSLMRASRAWRHVVEPEFYREVEVRDGRILLFCDTIDARSDLAPYVRNLLYRRGIDRPPQPSDYNRLYALLRKLPSLTELRDDLSCSRYSHQLVDESDAGYLLYKDLPCRLERFSTSLRFKPIMADVLRSLPYLRDFCNAHIKTDAALVPSGILPSCTVLRAGPNLLRSLVAPYPPLQHLTFKWPNFNVEEEASYPEEICLIGQNLKSLCIYRVSHDFRDYMSMPGFLRRFAFAAPNLVQFAILDGFEFSPRDNMYIRKLVTRHFRKLKVYIWIPRFYALTKLGDAGWDTDEEEGDIVDPDVDDDEPLLIKEERYAFMHFRDIPSLQYFVTGEYYHRMYKRISLGDKGEFRLELRQCMARFDGLKDMVHFINPDRPEDYLMYRIVNHDHYRFPPDPHIALDPTL